jgi:hypothetical protein
VTYFLFSTDGVLALTFFRSGSISPDEPGINSYFERVVFSGPTPKPGDIDGINRESSAYRIGYFIGRTSVVLIPVIIVGVVVGVSIWRSAKKREAVKKDTPDLLK